METRFCQCFMLLAENGTLKFMQTNQNR